MLIISRKKEQKIILADEIEITVLELGKNRVRFGIKAPKNIPVHTRLKASPAPAAASEKVTEAVGKEPQDSPIEALSAAARATKHR